MRNPVTLLFVVTEDWYFRSHRLPVARAARDAGWRVVVATRVGEEGEAIAAEGFDVFPLELRRGEHRPWREFGAFSGLLRVHREVAPDIAHHVALKPILYGGPVTALTRVPVVVNAIAGMGFVFTSEGPRARLLRPVVRLALALLLRRRASYSVVQNPDDAAAIRALGVPAERVVTIPGSGVDTVRFAPTPEPAEPVVAALVSRMLWDKGVGEFVEAARLLRAQGVPLRLWLVGAPDPENPGSVPAEQLRAWEAEGVVTWRGVSDDVPGVWARAHIAVLPSYREGLPKSLLEAAACSRALIAADVPGSREVARHRQTGLLVPPRDPVALARAIRTLGEDGQLRRRLGDEGRRLAEREFSEAHIVRRTLDLYRQALKRTRRGQPGSWDPS